MTELDFLSRAADFYRERCGGTYPRIFDGNRAEEAVQDVVDSMTDEEREEWDMAYNPALPADPFLWDTTAAAEMGDKLETYIDGLYEPDPDMYYEMKMTNS